MTYPQDWFIGLLTSGQWAVVIIVLSLVVAVVMSIWAAADDESAMLGFFSGLLLPVILWGIIFLIGHFLGFLVWLWNHG